MSTSFKDRLKAMDAHSSVSKEFRVYTEQGAVLSVITVLLIAYFVTTEFYYNFQVVLHEKVHVNATTPRGVELEFEIEFPEIPCSKLQVDANDLQGQAQSLHLDAKHHVWKHRLGKDDNGQVYPIGDRTKFEFGSTFRTESDLLKAVSERGDGQPPDNSSGQDGPGANDEECGSCYGAGEDDECCNTCEDVHRAYKRRGWVIGKDLAKITQCQGLQEDDADAAEGCDVHGRVALSSGGGNFHLAPGMDALPKKHALSMMDFIFESFHQWNVTHKIHMLRFGPEYPAATYQLDGHFKNIEDTYGMFQYYIQIVPTLYKFRNGTTIQTNQYSVTEHLRHVRPGSNRGLPGVFFFYEVSPLHVEIQEGYRKGWISFLTSLCAIVGGVVTTLGMVDQWIFHRKRPGHTMDLLR